MLRATLLTLILASSAYAQGPPVGVGPRIDTMWGIGTYTAFGSTMGVTVQLKDLDLATYHLVVTCEDHTPFTQVTEIRAPLLPPRDVDEEFVFDNNNPPPKTEDTIWAFNVTATLYEEVWSPYGDVWVFVDTKTTLGLLE